MALEFPMDRLRRGVSAYAAMIRLFSRNVWLVLLFGIGSGLTFGVFLLRSTSMS